MNIRSVVAGTLFALVVNTIPMQGHASNGWRASLQAMQTRCMEYRATFVAAGRAFNLSPAFLMAIAQRESACMKRARSKERANNGEHALGLMQLLPSTFREVRKKHNLRDAPLDPHVSIWAAAGYLDSLRSHDYRWGEELLIAYRWGPRGARTKRGKEHEQAYVQDVLYAWRHNHRVFVRPTH